MACEELCEMACGTTCARPEGHPISGPGIDRPETHHCDLTDHECFTKMLKVMVAGQPCPVCKMPLCQTGVGVYCGGMPVPDKRTRSGTRWKRGCGYGAYAL